MEKLGRTEKLALALHMNVSMAAAEIMVRLYNDTVVSAKDLVDDGVSAAPRRMISKLRPLMAQRGIAVHTHRGTGYWIDDEGRAALLSVARNFVGAPVNADDAAAELAAATRDGNPLSELEV